MNNKKRLKRLLAFIKKIITVFKIKRVDTGQEILSSTIIMFYNDPFPVLSDDHTVRGIDDIVCDETCQQQQTEYQKIDEPFHSSSL
jgi:hypothetical protein